MYQEIAVAKDTDEGTIQQEIEDIFSPKAKPEPEANLRARAGAGAGAEAGGGV